MKKEYKAMMDKIEMNEEQKAKIVLKAQEKAQGSYRYKKLAISVVCLFVLVGGFMFFQNGRTPNITNNNSVMIPNPLSDYQSIDELKCAAFDFTYPSNKNYQIEGLTLIASKLVQLEMREGEITWTYRIAEGSDDISGDYNVYENEETIMIEQWNVTTKGNGTRINLAVWHDETYSYCLSFDQGVDKNELIAMIESIC